MAELIPILVEYIKSRQVPGGHVILAAHNARCFDVPFLLKEFSCCSFDVPPDWLFLDTLALARELRKLHGKSYKNKRKNTVYFTRLMISGTINRIKGSSKDLTSGSS